MLVSWNSSDLLWCVSICSGLSGHMIILWHFAYCTRSTLFREGSYSHSRDQCIGVMMRIMLHHYIIATKRISSGSHRATVWSLWNCEHFLCYKELNFEYYATRLLLWPFCFACKYYFMHSSIVSHWYTYSVYHGNVAYMHEPIWLWSVACSSFAGII